MRKLQIVLFIFILLLGAGGGYFGYQFFKKTRANSATTNIVSASKEIQGDFHEYGVKLNLSKDYIWELNFEKEIDENTVSKTTVFVVDIKKNKVDVQTELSEDKRTLRISSPKGGYKEGAYYELYIKDDLQYADGKRDEESAKMPFIIKREDKNTFEYNKDVVDLSKLQEIKPQNNQFVVSKNLVSKPIKKGTILLIPTGEVVETTQGVKVTEIVEQGETYQIRYVEAKFGELFAKLDIYKVITLKDATIVPGSVAPGLDVKTIIAASNETASDSSSEIVKAKQEQDFFAMGTSTKAMLDSMLQTKKPEIMLGTLKDFSQNKTNTSQTSFQNDSVLPTQTASKPTFKVNTETEVTQKGETNIDLEKNEDGALAIKFNNFALRKDDHDFVVNGEVTINPDIIFNIDFEFLKLHSLTVGEEIKTEENMNLSIVPVNKNSDAVAVEIKQHLFDVDFPIYAPAAITGTFEFYLYMEWDYKRMQPIVRVIGEQKLSGGVHLNEGDVKPFFDFSHEESAKLGGQIAFEVKEGVGAEVIANAAKIPIVGIEGNGGLYLETKAAVGAESKDDVELNACLKVELGAFVDSKANIKVMEYFDNDKREKEEFSVKIYEKKFPAKKLGDSCSSIKEIEVKPDELKLRPGQEKDIEVVAVIENSYDLDEKEIDLLDKEKTREKVSFHVSDPSALSITKEGEISVSEDTQTSEATITVVYKEKDKEYKTTIPVEIAVKKAFNLKPEEVEVAKRFDELFGHIVSNVYQYAESETLPPFDTIVPELQKYATDDYINSGLKSLYKNSRGVLDSYPFPWSSIPIKCDIQDKKVYCQLLELNVESGNGLYDAYMVKENGSWKISKTSAKKDVAQLTPELAQAAVAKEGGFKDIVYLGEQPSSYGGDYPDYLFEVFDPKSNRTKKVSFNSNGFMGINEEN